MNKSMTKINFISFFLILIFDTIAIGLNVSLMYLCTLNIWFVLMLYAVSRLKKRSLLFMFLISFFVFLLGGHFCYEFLGMSIAHFYSDEIYFHSNLCLFISLVTIFCACWGSEHTVIRSTNQYSIEIPQSNNVETKRIVNKELIRNVSKLFYYAAYVFWLYTLLDTITYVMTNSYYSYYTDYTSNAPFAVRAIAAMTPYFFYLFLATFPNKKQCRCPLALYLIYAVLSLFTGKRGNFVFMGLFVVLYYILRHFKQESEDVWIKRKYVVFAIAVLPLLSVMLYGLNFIRFGNELSNDSVVEMLFGFFQSQGVSSSVIRMEKYYESSLNSDTYYSLFGIVKYFRTNTILKIIFNPQYNFSYVHNNVALATKGNSLDDALSYLALHNYLSGAGTGSCYIAELYHDAGYIGVILGNIIYGIVITKIQKIWNRAKRYNVWATAICFAMVESFLKAPRWNFDIIFAYFLDLGMWMAFALVYVVVKIRASVGKFEN